MRKNLYANVELHKTWYALCCANGWHGRFPTDCPGALATGSRVVSGSQGLGHDEGTCKPGRGLGRGWFVVPQHDDQGKGGYLKRQSGRGGEKEHSQLQARNKKRSWSGRTRSEVRVIARAEECRNLWRFRSCSSSSRSSTPLSWRRGRSPWSRPFRRLWRFTSCSRLIRWSMPLLARDYMREEPKLHLEFYQRDITGGVLAPRKLPVFMVSKSFQEIVKLRKNSRSRCSLLLGWVFHSSAWIVSTTMRCGGLR